MHSYPAASCPVSVSAYEDGPPASPRSSSSWPKSPPDQREQHPQRSGEPRRPVEPARHAGRWHAASTGTTHRNHNKNEATGAKYLKPVALGQGGLGLG